MLFFVTGPLPGAYDIFVSTGMVQFGPLVNHGGPLQLDLILVLIFSDIYGVKNQSVLTFYFDFMLCDDE